METQYTLCFEATSQVEPYRPAFEHLINETIDNVLSSLGTRCREAIYDYIDRKYNLRKSDIADHTMEFSEALERIFGSAAALLEMQIMKELFRKAPQFKHRPQGKLTFPDYVNALIRFLRDATEASPSFLPRTNRKNRMPSAVMKANLEKLV